MLVVPSMVKLPVSVPWEREKLADFILDHNAATRRVTVSCYGKHVTCELLMSEVNLGPSGLLAKAHPGSVGWIAHQKVYMALLTHGEQGVAHGDMLSLGQ